MTLQQLLDTIAWYEHKAPVLNPKRQAEYGVRAHELRKQAGARILKEQGKAKAVAFWKAEAKEVEEQGKHIRAAEYRRMAIKIERRK